MAKLDPRRSAGRIVLADEPEFELGGVKVQPADLSVGKGDQRRELQPRIMKVLVALARSQSEVISRDRLVEMCWEGRIVGDDAINRCVLSLRQLSQEFTPAPFSLETVPRVGHRLLERHVEVESSAAIHRRILIGMGAVVALLALTFAAARGGMWPWGTEAHVPTVFVTGAAGDARSRAFARELAVDLGNLHGIEWSSVRLVSDLPSSAAKPNLVLEVARAADPRAQGANVTLRAGRDRSILWSKQFDDFSQRNDGLRQQIVFGAGRPLGCALEGLGSKDALNQPLLKTYITACTALSESDDEVAKTAQMLREVVTASPHFISGWSKLLLAETAIVSGDERQNSLPKAALARDIGSARKVDSNLPEAYIAEQALTAPNDFLHRSRLLEAAVTASPTNAAARLERSIFLQSVGRTNAALRDAEEAARLDPLSPIARDNYLTALAMSGRMSAAIAELNKAQRIWPGSPILELSEYRLSLRFGDPREALRLIESGAVTNAAIKIHEPFLKARIDRSPDKIERAIERGRKALSTDPEAIASHAQTLAEFDRRDELINLLLSWRRMDVVDSVANVLFRPAFLKVHRDPRFIGIAQHLGLLRYWRTTNRWPDFCFAPDLPYDCKAEAAKVAP